MLECEWDWGQEGTTVSFSGKRRRMHLAKPQSQGKSNLSQKNREKTYSASPEQDRVKLNPKIQGRNDRELFPC